MTELAFAVMTKEAEYHRTDLHKRHVLLVRLADLLSFADYHLLFGSLVTRT